jgi:hypothetical protein
VARDLSEPQRPRVLDQQPKQSPSFRPVINSGDNRLIQPDRDEVRQPAVLADNTKRAIAGVHEGNRGLHDPPQHILQLQIAADRDNRLQQAVHTIPRSQHRLHPALQLRKQIIEPQVWQHWVRLRGLHECLLPGCPGASVP